MLWQLVLGWRLLHRVPDHLPERVRRLLSANAITAATLAALAALASTLATLAAPQPRLHLLQ